MEYLGFHNRQESLDKQLFVGFCKKQKNNPLTGYETNISTQMKAAWVRSCLVSACTATLNYGDCSLV